MKKCIIIANGDLPKKSVVTFLQKKNYSTLICADGGANSAHKLKLIPDFIIGDFDSIDKNIFKTFRSRSKFIKIKRQNDTDVEKCLKFAIKNKYDEVVLLGATGDRLDHSICNIGISLKYFEKIKISLVHKNSILVPYSGIVNLNTEIGEIVSLYGFDSQTTIDSKGLKYQLKNVALPFGKKESTSNVAISNCVNLKIKNGIVLVIRDFDIMRKYDIN